MRIGECAQARGFTYLWLLFAIAIGAAALAALGMQWQTALQREREIELEFRGQSIARAIESYARATPPGRPLWPARREDLLEDRRGAAMQRHLRRIHDDPFTGHPDWVLLTDADERIHGVRSRAEVPALRVPLAASAALSASAPAPKVSDRSFSASVAPPPLPAASAVRGASPASGLVP